MDSSHYFILRFYICAWKIYWIFSHPFKPSLSLDRFNIVSCCNFTYYSQWKWLLFWDSILSIRCVYRFTAQCTYTNTPKRINNRQNVFSSRNIRASHQRLVWMKSIPSIEREEKKCVSHTFLFFILLNWHKCDLGYCRNSNGNRKQQMIFRAIQRTNQQLQNINQNIYAKDCENAENETWISTFTATK